MIPRVLGLDLSIAATGVAHPDGTLDVWKLPVDLGDRRLNTLRSLVDDALGANPVDLVTIEDLPYHARAAGITGMVHGVIRQLLIAEGVRYQLVPPATLKTYATGHGNATKDDMRMELYKRASIDDRDHNRVDAAWLRLLGLDLLGHPELDLPQSHRRALDKLTDREVA